MISGTHTDLTTERTWAASPGRALFYLITLCKGKTSKPHSSKSFPIYPDLTFISYQTPNALLNILDYLERQKQSHVHVCFSPTQGALTWGELTWAHLRLHSSQTYLWHAESHQHRGTHQHRAFGVEKRINKVVLLLVNVKMNSICLRSLSLTKCTSDRDVTQLWNS